LMAILLFRYRASKGFVAANLSDKAGA